MFAYLTIVRYPKYLSWAGFLSMAIFRLPLILNGRATFYKLLGCGKNGTFDKTPDVSQWGILMVSPGLYNKSNYEIDYAELYGRLIDGWWKFFGCSTWTIVLQPIEGHGTWDGKKVFGDIPRNSGFDGVIAVLTRATIRLNKLSSFWKHVDGVARHMQSSKGFITSLGIGEVPWIKQATFSVWTDKESVKAFSYKRPQHIEVIKKTRDEKWYSEEMFVRFKIIASIGLLQNKNPLEDFL